MKSWSILSHSAQLVWRNRQEALKISALLYGIAMVAQITLGAAGPGPMDGSMPGPMDGPMEMEMSPGNALGVLVSALLQIVLTLWIAVSWHRFVLLEEYPTGWLPPLHGGRMAAYLLRSLLIGVIVLLAAAAASLPFGLLAAILPPLAILAPIAAVVASIVVSFRLAPMLPGTATDRSLGVKEALQGTRGATATALGLAIISVLALILIQIPVMVLFMILPLLGLVGMVVAGWFVTLVSVSVLTTIYGHYVEGRTLG